MNDDDDEATPAKDDPVPEPTPDPPGEAPTKLPESDTILENEDVSSIPQSETLMEKSATRDTVDPKEVTDDS